MAGNPPAATPAAGVPAAPTYTTKCPNCGNQLQPVALDPQTAPWLCGPPAGCSQGWFPSQLSASGRQAWRSQYRDFGGGADAQAVHDAVANDLAAAASRGTSALPEHLLLLGLPVLQQLGQNQQLSAQFQALVAAAVKAKGG